MKIYTIIKFYPFNEGIWGVIGSWPTLEQAQKTLTSESVEWKESTDDEPYHYWYHENSDYEIIDSELAGAEK